MKKIALIVAGFGLVFGGLWVYQAHEFEKFVSPLIDQYKSLNPVLSADNITLKKYRFTVAIEKPAASSLGIPGIPQGHFQMGDKIMVHYMPLTRRLKTTVTGPLRFKLALDVNKRIDVYTDNGDITVGIKPSSFFGDSDHQTISVHFGPHTVFSGSNNKPIFSFKDIDLTQFSRKKDGGKGRDTSLGLHYAYTGFQSADDWDHFLDDLNSLAPSKFELGQKVQPILNQLSKNQRSYEGALSGSLSFSLDVNGEKYKSWPSLLLAVQEKTPLAPTQFAPLKLTLNGTQKSDLGSITFSGGLDMVDEIDGTLHLSSKVEPDKITLYKEKIFKPAIPMLTPFIQGLSQTSITSAEIEKLAMPFLKITEFAFDAHIQTDGAFKTTKIEKIALTAPHFDLSLAGTMTPATKKIQLTLGKAKQVSAAFSAYLNGSLLPVLDRLFGNRFPIPADALGPIVTIGMPRLIDALHNGPPPAEDGAMTTLIEQKEENGTLFINGKEIGELLTSPAIVELIGPFQGIFTQNP